MPADRYVLAGRSGHSVRCGHIDFNFRKRITDHIGYGIVVRIGACVGTCSARVASSRAAQAALIDDVGDPGVNVSCASSLVSNPATK
ncbi:hypothetical protein [Stenotrophomonas phage CM2]